MSRPNAGDAGQLAGIYWFDESPLDGAGREDCLSASTRHSAKERPGLLVAWDESCAIAETADTWCVLDGRVDHKTIVAGSALALQLYQQSEAAGLGNLIGDWSLALWDGPRRTLLLASDYAGARPLYYFQSARCLAWSSSLSHLARWMKCDRLDLDYVSDFLDTGFPRQLTPFRGIHPVPAGVALAVSPQGTMRNDYLEPAVGRVRSLCL